jgi:hypothetical protein
MTPIIWRGYRLRVFNEIVQHKNDHEKEYLFIKLRVSCVFKMSYYMYFASHDVVRWTIGSFKIK